MSITTLTLFGVFIAVWISTYNSYENNCKSALTRTLGNNLYDGRQNNINGNDPGANNKPEGKPDAAPQKPSSGTAVSGSVADNRDPGARMDFRNRPGQQRDTSIVMTAKYSSEKGVSIIEANNSVYTLSEEETTQLVTECISSGKEYGKRDDYSFAYMYRKGKNDITIAFYDTSNDIQALKMLVVTFTIVGLVGIFFFYLLSLFLSRWCIHPIEKAWQQQKNFVADASHELKTPLTVILANTSLLRQSLSDSICPDKSPSEYEKYLDYIGEEANHMSHLVNDMLFLAKADAQRETETIQTIDLSDICLNCALSFESVAYEKKIIIDSDIEENIQMKGMPEKLSQLCAILLDNACKYTEPEGHIRITLSQKGNHVTLRVNNSGQPIEKEQLKHLFDRFYRVDEARTRKSSGYGLGLSIASQIVQLHNGKIEVQSNEQEGTTFLVHFPS